MASDVLSAVEQHSLSETAEDTQRLLGALIQSDQYVGEVYHMSYGQALVQVHDFFRRKAGGIPGLSFLVASRKRPEDTLDFRDEAASVLLLRVQDSAALPQDSEAVRLRVEAAQRVSGKDADWDSPDNIDPFTHNVLGFAGLKCRILGTFYVVERDGRLSLKFGSDISNFYSNSALRVYKPNGAALRLIANHLDEDLSGGGELSSVRVEIGSVRYASTDRQGQHVDDVRVSIAPADLLNMKTALFGMTRTGKSNSTKIIAKSVYELRFDNPQHGRIGQLIFDINGEYANVNVQDAGALKNVWRSKSAGDSTDVVTYGTEPHENDPDRRLLKINFYEPAMLGIGKAMLDKHLNEDQAEFVKAFRTVDFSEPPDASDKSATTRWTRRVLAYHALLAKAGFGRPPSMSAPRGKGLFKKELLTAMEESEHDMAAQFESAAATLREINTSTGNPTWGALISALENLHWFISKRDSGWKDFDDEYIRGSSTGESWADPEFRALVHMIAQQNGANKVRRMIDRHTHTVTSDYADQIVQDLHSGRLVIVDQSLGDEDMNQIVADRIVEKLFNTHQRLFSTSKTPPEILVYIEEAHNRLPKGSETDVKNIWVRLAKEGAKLRIGMVYATQEVSSVQRNILKNTSNWFIGHLNNTDETRELTKYYDFADYEESIIRAQNAGFLRVKTRSNPYVVPVQIHRFAMNLPGQAVS